MVWDTEVDVLCVGAGIGGLAVAIAAADADADVMISTAHAELPPTGAGAPSAELRAWLHSDVSDEETAQYLGALVEDFGVTAADAVDGAIPTRVAGDRPTDTRTVPTFVGARVASWGGACSRSATGALLTTVLGWTTTEMRDSGGRQILVAPVGDDIECGSTHEFAAALAAGVDKRDIEVEVDSRLHRLVFEGGAVVGAVLDSPDGQLTVRARLGVVISPDLLLPADVPRPAAASQAKAFLVSIPGSRFARVELVSPLD